MTKPITLVLKKNYDASKLNHGQLLLGYERLTLLWNLGEVVLCEDEDRNLIEVAHDDLRHDVDAYQLEA